MTVRSEGKQTCLCPLEINKKYWAVRGGAWSNDSNCGAFYVNLNNSAANANGNFGAAIS